MLLTRVFKTVTYNNLLKLADGRGEPEASRTLCAYLMESAIQKLPEGTESVLGIFDFRGAGPQNIDIDFAKFLVSIFMCHSDGLVLYVLLDLKCCCQLEPPPCLACPEILLHGVGIAPNLQISS